MFASALRIHLIASASANDSPLPFRFFPRQRSPSRSVEKHSPSSFRRTKKTSSEREGPARGLRHGIQGSREFSRIVDSVRCIELAFVYFSRDTVDLKVLKRSVVFSILRCPNKRNLSFGERPRARKVFDRASGQNSFTYNERDERADETGFQVATGGVAAKPLRLHRNERIPLGELAGRIQRARPVSSRSRNPSRISVYLRSPCRKSILVRSFLEGSI